MLSFFKRVALLEVWKTYEQNNGSPENEEGGRNDADRHQETSC